MANGAAVIGRKHDEILNLWVRSPAKFIKFLRRAKNMKFCIETHRDQNFVMKFEISKTVFKFLNAYSAPFKHRSCIITILFRTEPNLLS